MLIIWNTLNEYYENKVIYIILTNICRYIREAFELYGTRFIEYTEYDTQYWLILEKNFVIV